MRNFMALLFVTTLIPLSSAFAGANPRYAFQLPPSTGDVQLFQITLVPGKGVNVHANVVAVLKSKQTHGGTFVCKPQKMTEYLCERQDDGGSFVLVDDGSNAPKLRFNYFDVADEGDDVDAPVNSPTRGQAFEVLGRKL